MGGYISRWINGDRVVDLAKYYRVSRNILYEAFHKAKPGMFGNFSSKNMRYRTLEYGLRKILSTERKLEKKIAKRALRLNRYVKKYSGEMVHADSSVLSLIPGEALMTPREYLYVFVNDCSMVLFADILSDQTSYSVAIVLDEALQMLPFQRREKTYPLCHCPLLQPPATTSIIGRISPFAFLKKYIDETKNEIRELKKSVTNA